MKTKRIAVFAAAAGLVIAGLALPAPAFAAGTGTLNVQLVTPAGAHLGVSGVEIAVVSKSSAGLILSSEHATNSAGLATFTGEPSGKHLDTEVYSNGTYVGGTKTDQEVSSGATKTITVTDPQGGAVSGTVKDGVNALSGAYVALYSTSGRAEYSALSTSAGGYSITGVASGTYLVQFNSRAFTSQSAAALAYTWSYWAGSTHPSTTSWSDAKKIVVTQQKSHTPPSSTTAVDGVVTAGVTLSGTVDYWSTPSSHANQDVLIVATHSANSFYTKLNSSGELSVTLNPGKYRIAIYGDRDYIIGATPIYWYRTDTEGPTSSEDKATWIDVTANQSITFVKQKLLL